MKNALDVIIPVSIELDWPTKESVIQTILYEHKQYGFTRFALAGPCGGWRSAGYPPQSHIRNLAELAAQVIRELEPYGISCGWWITLTARTGPTPEFQPMIRMDGTAAPTASCPLDPAFRKRFSQDVALFAKIAKPAFIITEDDFSIAASTNRMGCFCPAHLAEFSRREGKSYTRQELGEIFQQQTPEAMALLRRWQKLMGQSLVGMAESVRAALDIETPQIPMGSMQPGGDDFEGCANEQIARAFAGKQHIPFSRICGVTYCGIDSKNIPVFLHHPLYTKQRLREPFRAYHESDTYPHTRFFSSGAQMRALMGSVYSYGFVGSTHQTEQLLDDPCEETTYGKTFARERERYNAVYRHAQQCRLAGVEVCYDPFWNRIDKSKKTPAPLWLRSVSHFGIPHTTLPAPVAFWDDRQAKYADHETVMKYLSKGLFLDADAARTLCQRGYGQYLGVTMGEPVTSHGLIGFDLGAREVICEDFRSANKGTNMPSAHMWAVGKNGIQLKMTVTDSACQVVSELVTFQKEPVTPAMTRFENTLGGRIVVLGMTLDGNQSQSLFNYRRQRLIQQLLIWCNDSVAFVKDAPCVYTIMNEAKDPASSGFLGMLTLTNLSEDAVDTPVLHLPERWRGKQFLQLDEKGEYQPLEAVPHEDGIQLNQPLPCLTPLYIIIK